MQVGRGAASQHRGIVQQVHWSSTIIITMKSVIIASLLASACAFAPASVSRTSTSLNEFANGYVGGEGPEPMFIGETGSKNFDPFGFCEVRSSY